MIWDTLRFLLQAGCFAAWLVWLSGGVSMRTSLIALGVFVFTQALADSRASDRLRREFPDALDQHIRDRVSPIVARTILSWPNARVEAAPPDPALIVAEIDRWFEHEFERQTRRPVPPPEIWDDEPDEELDADVEDDARRASETRDVAS